MNRAHRLYRFIPLGVVILVALYSCWRYVDSHYLAFRPERVENPSGWKPFRVGGGISFVGQFVLRKGESTDNGELGVKVMDIMPGPPAPPATTSMESDGSKAVLRFYRVSDRSVICDFTSEASSTSYDTRYICGGKLPFTNLEVRGIDSEEGWVFFSFFNLDGVAKPNP
jgi:hypothetical protein